MPAAALKKFAEDSHHSYSTLERWWKEAEKQADVKGFEEDRKYRYMMGIVKRRAGLARVMSSAMLPLALYHGIDLKVVANGDITSKDELTKFGFHGDIPDSEHMGGSFPPSFKAELKPQWDEFFDEEIEDLNEIENNEERLLAAINMFIRYAGRHKMKKGQPEDTNADTEVSAKLKLARDEVKKYFNKYDILNNFNIGKIKKEVGVKEKSSSIKSFTISVDINLTPKDKSNEVNLGNHMSIVTGGLMVNFKVTKSGLNYSVIYSGTDDLATQVKGSVVNYIERAWAANSMRNRISDKFLV